MSLNDIDGITMEGLLRREKRRLRRRRRYYNDDEHLLDLSSAPTRLVPRKYRAAHRRLKNNPYYYHAWRDYQNRWNRI